MVKTTNQVYFNFKQEKSFMSSKHVLEKKQWNFTEKEKLYVQAITGDVTRVASSKMGIENKQKRDFYKPQTPST